MATAAQTSSTLRSLDKSSLVVTRQSLSLSSSSQFYLQKEPTLRQASIFPILMSIAAVIVASLIIVFQSSSCPGLELHFTQTISINFNGIIISVIINIITVTRSTSTRRSNSGNIICVIIISNTLWNTLSL